MRRCRCTCQKEDGKESCPTHTMRMDRNFWKYEENEDIELEENRDDY